MHRNEIPFNDEGKKSSQTTLFPLRFTCIFQAQNFPENGWTEEHISESTLVTWLLIWDADQDNNRQEQHWDKRHFANSCKQNCLPNYFFQRWYSLVPLFAYVCMRHTKQVNHHELIFFSIFGKVAFPFLSSKVKSELFSTWSARTNFGCWQEIQFGFSFIKSISPGGQHLLTDRAKSLFSQLAWIKIAGNCKWERERQRQTDREREREKGKKKLSKHK